jgi:hypothetical protein
MSPYPRVMLFNREDDGEVSPTPLPCSNDVAEPTNADARR